MSKTVDERIVEMRFDNKQFESNVKDTMSTLDKLKQKLKFDGATKGLDDINAASKKIDMSNLANSVENVGLKFNALYSYADQTMRDITTSINRTAKNLVNAVTIDPVKMGLSEYETKINAIQTIWSNTSSKGKTMDDITKVLDELNTYADKTIYNFAEMTKNIGTFTAAGVDLEDSASAIQGIANLAASSGSNSQQASTAMYQLSQALAAGSVKLQDWNSVVNAGMGGQKFQDALKQTAKEFGIDVDGMINKAGSFRESLKDGWISADVLNTTLKKFTQEGAAEYAESMLKSGKYTQEQADALIKEAQEMTDAATKVKTFTQLIDTLKEGMQSGWTQTWELIIGDFDEARELWSGIYNFFGGIIDAMSTARNTLLEGALGKSFSGLADKIKTVTKPIEKSAESVKKVVDTVKDYNKVVDDIMAGIYGNGQARWDKLTEEGYDWAHAQNMVNERLGDSTRYATKYNEATKEVAKTQEEVVETNNALIADLVMLSDAELEAAGYTQEQIDALRELEYQADKVGIPLQEFIDNIDKIDGRYLLLNSFTNVFKKGLYPILVAIGDAWRDAFPPMSSDTLYDIIAGIHKLSTYFIVSGDTAEELTRTFQGLFAIIDIIASLTGGVFKIGFQIIKEVATVLGYVDFNILSITATIGDAIVAFRDWFEENNLITQGIQLIVPLIIEFAYALKELITQFLALPEVQNGIATVVEFFKTVPANIIKGFTEGLQGGAQDVINAGIEMVRSLLEKVKEVLGIHSPSTEFKAVGEYAIEGLIEGTKESTGKLLDTFKEIGTKILEVIKGIDFSKVFVVGSVLGVGVLATKFVGIMDKFAAPAEKLGDVLENVSDVVETFGKSMNRLGKAKALEMKSNAFYNIAKAIGVLAVSLLLLTKVEPGLLWNAVAVVGALAVGLIVLMKVLDGMDNPVEFGKIGILIIGIAASLSIMASALKKIAEIDSARAWTALLQMALLVGGIAAVLYAYGKFVKGKAAQNIDKAGIMLLKLSVGLLILATALKVIASLSNGDIGKGIQIMVAVGILFGAMIAVSTLAGKHADKAGNMIKKMAVAIGILAIAMKLIATMSISDIVKGLAVVAGCMLLFEQLVLVSLFAGKHAAQAGLMILQMSIAVGILAIAMKLIATMSLGDIAKGMIVIAGCMLLFEQLVLVSIFAGKHAAQAGLMISQMGTAIALLAIALKIMAGISLQDIAKGMVVIGTVLLLFEELVVLSYFAGENASKVGTMVLKMSVAILILVAAIMLLSLLKPEDVVRGTAAISALLLCFTALLAVSAIAKNCIKSVTTMLVAIGLLIGAMALLTMLDPAKLQGASLAITYITLALTALMLASKFAKPAVGAVLLMVGVVMALGLIFAALQYFNVTPSIETAKAISILLLTMTAVCAGLAIIGNFAGAAIAGAGAFAGVVGIIGTLMIAIGALMHYVPQVEEFLDKGISVLGKIGEGIGSFVGGIVNGVLTNATSGLEEVGNNLSDFMLAAMPFIRGAKLIDQSVVTGVKALAETVLLLTAADVLEGLTSWFTGGSSFSKFGEELAAFGPHLKDYADSIAGIDASTISASANAAKTLAEFANNIPNTGGLAAFFAGENSMLAFAEQLVPFGEKLADYSKAVEGINGDNVIKSAEAAKGLSDLANNIPNTGGLAGLFTGENDLATFARKLIPFGTALTTYSDTVANLDPAPIKASASAAKALVKMAEEIPKSGGLASIFTGDNDLSAFATKLVPFGKALIDYAKAVDGLNVDAVSNATKACKKMVSMINDMAHIDKSGVNSFKEAVESLSQVSLTSFTEAFNNTTTGTKAIGSGLLDSLSAGLKEKQTQTANSFKDVGGNIVNKVSEGITSNKSKPKTSMSDLVSNMGSAVSSKTSKFKDLGGDLVNGFANGITANTFKAEAKAAAMANDAYGAAQRALDSHSPSRVFEKLGSFVPEGFAKGIAKMGNVVATSATGMADTAIESTSDVIARIAEAIESDVDTQPTIRPVLDLSAVTSDAKQLNNMFGASLSVGGMGNIKSISGMMNNRQNGVDQELVSAIRDLNKNGVAGNTYNINGITYESGSEVSNAIEALVRAVKIEGRT